MRFTLAPAHWHYKSHNKCPRKGQAKPACPGDTGTRAGARPAAVGRALRG